MIILILKLLKGPGIAILLIAALCLFIWWRRSDKGKEKASSLWSKLVDFVKNFHNAVASGFKGESGYSDQTANILATIIVALLIIVII